MYWMCYMGIRHAVNDWLSILLKVMAIIALVIGVTWFGISIYGNIKLNSDGMPDPPKETKAEYEVLVSATGQSFFTDEYDTIAEGVYELKGYYEIIDGKWKHRDGDLLLDEYYFGDITINRR